jgi:uncharacterized protein YukE
MSTPIKGPFDFNSITNTQQQKPAQKPTPTPKPALKITQTSQPKQPTKQTQSTIPKITAPTQQPLLQSPSDTEAKNLIDNFNKLQQQLNESQKKYNEVAQQIISDTSKRKSELTEYFKKMDDALKQTDDIPTIKTYKDIVQENSKLMPLMVGLIALGTAVFGNRDGTTMADKMGAMFGALKEKNLTDWKTASEDFKSQLEQWKVKSENIYNKVNMMMQKLMMGEKIDDELAKFKTDFANTNLNTNLSLLSIISKILPEVERMQQETKLKVAQLNMEAPYYGALTQSLIEGTKEKQALTAKNTAIAQMLQEANQAYQEYAKALDKGDQKLAAKWLAKYQALIKKIPSSGNSGDGGLDINLTPGQVQTNSNVVSSK